MVKSFLHGLAWRAERLVDSYLVSGDDRRTIEPYLGYATPDHLVVRGRVLSALRRTKPDPTHSAWTNFRQMASLFFTREVASAEVIAQSVTAVSDDEGYFNLPLPRWTVEGWVDIEVSLTDADDVALCPVLVPRQDAAFGIISDIDDTMLETGAYSLARNLWTSFTGNALTRRVFPDAVSFLSDLGEGGRNPVYYVSSSPWNLHHFLERVFARHNLPKGPKFLRDLGVSKTKFITGTHGDHKGSSIDVLMAANPTLTYVLVGDTGQHDAEVYRDAVLRHPGRIRAVVLREPGPGPDPASREAMSAIEAAGVILLHGPDFTGFAKRLVATAD